MTRLRPTCSLQIFVLCAALTTAPTLSAAPQAGTYGARACQTRRHRPGDNRPSTKNPPPTKRKPMHTRHDNQELLGELKILRAALADPHTTVSDLIRRVGEPGEKVQGSGYMVHPSQAWFSGVFVGLNTDAGAAERPTDIDMTLRPNITLHLADLDAAFGRHTVGRPNRVFPFTYEYRAPVPSDRVVVFAYLRRVPSDPQSRVEEIKILRDE